MSRDIPESDWKIFRKLREIALNRFCERILSELACIATDTKGSPHARYLSVYELVEERDKQIAQAFNDVRRSTAVAQLAVMASLNVVSQEELALFTELTQSRVQVLRELSKKSRAPKKD